VKPGYNTNIRLGDALYHVQTEDRGAGHPFIDTIVYVEGRVLHRRSTPYGKLCGSAKPGEAVLRERIEQQHRGVVEELRAGTLKLDLAAPAGIEARLLNPTSSFSLGRAALQIEVRERGTQRPAADVQVEATLEGAADPGRFAACTDTEGRAELSFSLPPLGPKAATLVIRAAGLRARTQSAIRLSQNPGRPPNEHNAPRHD
jgi:hypothetical protein